MSLTGDLATSYALISSPFRAISFLIPDVVISELSSDDLAVTDHAVETGAAISDHAFKLPTRLEIRCGWSNSTAEVEGFVQQIDAALLSLQARREPFTVYAGKRVHQSMLLGRIAVETDESSENTLMVVLGLRGVIRTQTQMTGAGQNAQAMPERTGSISETGTILLADNYTTAGDPRAALSGPGANRVFLGSDGNLGLGPSGASAGFAGELVFDGIPFNSGLPDLVSTTDPSAIPFGPGNALGQFGQYGPNTFLTPKPFRV